MQIIAAPSPFAPFICIDVVYFCLSLKEFSTEDGTFQVIAVSCRCRFAFMSSLWHFWFLQTKRSIHGGYKMKTFFRTLNRVSLMQNPFHTNTQKKTICAMISRQMCPCTHQQITESANDSTTLKICHIYLCILILMKLVFSFHVYIFTQ